MAKKANPRIVVKRARSRLGWWVMIDLSRKSLTYCDESGYNNESYTSAAKAMSAAKRVNRDLGTSFPIEVEE